MTFKDAVGIFVRTFAALAGAGLLAVQGYDWSSSDTIRNNGYALGLMLLSAVVGSIVAVAWAFVASPAGTALEKGFRAAVEKVVGGLGAVAINSQADLVGMGKLIPSVLIAAALAFFVTLLSYVSPPKVTPPTTG